MGEGGGLTMKYCTQCGNPLPDQALFCSKCGHKQSSDPAPQQKEPEEVKPVEVEQPKEEASPAPAAEEAKATPKFQIQALKYRIIYFGAATLFFLLGAIFGAAGIGKTFFYILAMFWIMFALAICILGFVQSLTRKQGLFNITLSGTMAFILFLYMILNFVMMAGT